MHCIYLVSKHPLVNPSARLVQAHASRPASPVPWCMTLTQQRREASPHLQQNYSECIQNTLCTQTNITITTTTPPSISVSLPSLPSSSVALSLCTTTTTTTTLCQSSSSSSSSFRLHTQTQTSHTNALVAQYLTIRGFAGRLAPPPSSIFPLYLFR